MPMDRLVTRYISHFACRQLCHRPLRKPASWPALAHFKQSGVKALLLDCGHQPHCWAHRRALASWWRPRSGDNDDETTSAALARRHTGLHLHPDSISRQILPGNMIMRDVRGASRKRYVELAHGYFWMLKDLQLCHERPILPNEVLISEKMARPFPLLKNVRSLTGQVVDFPSYFMRRNRSGDVAAHCTLVAVSFRDFGHQQLPSWTTPFRQALGHYDRVEVIALTAHEGWMNRYFLRAFIQTLTRRNTPLEEHDSAFLHFDSNLETSFRDPLRMHNVMVGYVFLLDGLGRVRFAASGQAQEQDVEQLIQLAKDLVPMLRDPSPTSKSWHSGSNKIRPSQATGKRPTSPRSSRMMGKTNSPRST